ncbi:outer membrane protein assembly factor BamB family protein [Micromonospora sp. LZ34]
MTLIDLGELRDRPEPERIAGPRRPRPAGRPLRSVLVLAAVLVTVAAAAPPPGRVAADVPGSAADAFLADDRLYLAQPAEGVTDGTRDLVAYPLPDRATTTPQRPTPLWRVPVPGAGQFWGIQESHGAVLLSVAGLNGFQGGDTLVFEPDTGRLRWRQPGLARLDAAGRLLLETAGVDGPGTVRSVDLASGRALWSLSVPAEGAHYRGRDGLIEQLVVVTAGGAVEVYDAGTGTLLRRGELPSGGPPGTTYTQLVEDLLLVIDRQSGRLTGYELDGLRRRWEVELPLVAYVYLCGELLCAAGRSGGTRALDAATGQVRWTSATWTGLLPGRGGLLLGLATTGSGGDRVVVVDVTTGRELADLGAWQLVSARSADDRIVGTRPMPGGGVLVAELDVTTGRARGHDVLRDASGDCQVDREMLVCRRQGGGFVVRRLAG